MSEKEEREFPEGFFMEMEGKREENSKKGGWLGLGAEELMRLLQLEVYELRAEILWLGSNANLSSAERLDAFERVKKEAADVGNFAGFIWHLMEEKRKEEKDNG